MNDKILQISNPVLSISNLSIAYGKDKNAVIDVTADIKRHAITAIWDHRDVVKAPCSGRLTACTNYIRASIQKVK